MKKYKMIVALLTTSALLFTACALRAPKAETAPPPPVSEEPAETEAPAATPTPPSTVPDIPAPEKNGLYDLLTGVFDDCHFGTAGSSLKAARYAAEIVDWGMKNGTPAVQRGASAWDRGMENEFGEDLTDKLSNLYFVAFSFYGPGTDILTDCGWEGTWDYSARDVRRVFQTLFPALGAETPLIAAAFFPDEEAEHLRAQGVLLDEEDMADPVKALNVLLTTYAFPPEASVLSATFGDDVLALDVNEAFARHIRSMGTSGEQLTVAAAVNTALSLFDGAESVMLTVGGNALETGHNIYSEPIPFFKE